jgi:hypothetical protein
VTQSSASGFLDLGLAVVGASHITNDVNLIRTKYSRTEVDDRHSSPAIANDNMNEI